MPRISWTDIKIFVLRVAKYWCTRGAELLVQMEKQSIISRKFANCSINVVVFLKHTVHACILLNYGVHVYLEQ